MHLIGITWLTPIDRNRMRMTVDIYLRIGAPGVNGSEKTGMGRHHHE